MVALGGSLLAAGIGLAFQSNHVTDSAVTER